MTGERTSLSADSCGQRSYELLATAIAGRDLGIGTSKTEVIYTDGRSVYLPANSEAWCVPGLVVQSALLRCGSLNRKAAAMLLGQERMTARYLTLEAARVAVVADSVMPRRVQELIAKNWSGRISADAAESLYRAATDKSIPEAPELFGTIRPTVLLKGRIVAGGNPGDDGDRRSVERDVSLQKQVDEDGAAENNSPGSIDSLGSPSGNSPLSKFIKRTFGVKNTPSQDDGGSGSELPNHSVQWVKQISAGARLITTALGLSDWEPPAFDGAIYPEWDYRSSVYRPRRCQVLDYEPTVIEGLEHDLPDRILRRRLARLGMTYVSHHKQTNGENLDNDALVSFVVDTASGYSGDDRVYESRRKTGRDLSVLVLLDASGSTSDQRIGGLSTWEAQQMLARNTIAAFDDLGDVVAAYGFRSFGRNDIRFLRLKEFGGRFSQEARARVRSLKPAGYTRMGAAIRHATHLISTKAHTENQLLVVVSDGLPYDAEYEDTYAEQDVRRALGEAEELGVGCVCLSINSSRNEASLERVWGNVGHANLDVPSDLNRHAESLFRAALRRASMGGAQGRKHKDRATAA